MDSLLSWVHKHASENHKEHRQPTEPVKTRSKTFSRSEAPEMCVVESQLVLKLPPFD